MTRTEHGLDGLDLQLPPLSAHHHDNLSAPSFTDRDVVEIDMRTDEEARSPFVAYALWFFLGWFGVHRFYAGRPKSGLAMALLTVSMVGFVGSFFWWMADSIGLGRILQEEREHLRDRIARDILERKLGS